MNFYRASWQFGQRWVYADINTVLFGALNARDYLRDRCAGEQHGDSCGARALAAYGFDLWIKGTTQGWKIQQDRCESTGSSGFVGGLGSWTADARNGVPAYFRTHTDRFSAPLPSTGTILWRSAGACKTSFRWWAARSSSIMSNPGSAILGGYWRKLRGCR